MQQSSTLADRCTAGQRRQVRRILLRTEILPISCLFWWMDRPVPINPDRVVPDDLLYVPVKGALDCHVGELRRRVDPGRVMWAPAGIPHGAALAPGCEWLEAYALHMHVYDANHQPLLRRLSEPFAPLPEPAAWFDRFSVCTHLMGADPKLGTHYMKRLIGDLLVAMALTGVTLRTAPDPLDHRVARLVGQIREKPAHNWTLPEMARQSGVSVERIRQLFKASLGLPPSRYLRSVRLSRARSLLATAPSLTVGEVAQSVGFRNVHHFHAAYREAYAETPKRTNRS